jgi:hypothetical protein
MMSRMLVRHNHKWTTEVVALAQGNYLGYCGCTGIR